MPDEQGGYTLLEVLLVFALLGFLSAVSIPFSLSFFRKYLLEEAVIQTVYAARRASLMASSGYFDESWGIYLTAGQVIIFQGADYLSRDSSYDVAMFFADNVTVSGSSELVFDKLTGWPFSDGSITFTNPQGEERTVTINEFGVVDY